MSVTIACANVSYLVFLLFTFQFHVSMYSRHQGQTEDGFTDAMYHNVFAPNVATSQATGFIEWGCGNATVLLRLSELHPARGARFLGIEVDPDMAKDAREHTKHDDRITILCQTFIAADATPDEKHHYDMWYQLLPTNAQLMHYFNNHNYRMALDHAPERSFDSRLSLQVHNEFWMRAKKRPQTRRSEPDVFVSLGMVPNLTGWTQQKLLLECGQGWSWSAGNNCHCYKYTSALW